MRGQSVYLQAEHAQNVLSDQPFAICAFVQLSLNEIAKFEGTSANFMSWIAIFLSAIYSTN